MPAEHRSLDVTEVRRFAEMCFAPGGDRVGAEIEFLTVPRDDPLAHPDLAMVRAATAGPLRGGSRVTFEPGGQLELASGVSEDVGSAVDCLADDLSTIHDALRARGIALIGVGVDQLRPERRVLSAPRYDAMEAFFDCDGLSGRAMMCRTAAIQVNLDFGLDERSSRSRWRLAHAAGPAMAAAFANSPLWCGAPSGWRSTRLATWFGIDRSRTAPVGGDGPESWARYLLDARVMLVRRSSDDFVPMLEPLSFRSWMDNGHVLGWPTLDDLAYHATTLFPPVRPRGWLELRMCDALPDPWWKVPVLVWAGLMYGDPHGADAATRGCEGSWVEAARAGLEHPSLRDAARACFELASVALRDMGVDVSVVEAFAERYTHRGLSPADELLDGSSTVGMMQEPAWI